MREIKFRIWLGGKFYYWGFLDDGHGVGFHGLPETNAESLSIPAKMGRSQQFTGLLDKYGKEIYEGDVYKYENGDTYKVVFSGGGFTGQEVPDEFDSGDFELGGINNDYAEVIGNIYENPELLESEDKCHE